MQNLRDQLLKAGVATKQQKRQVEHDKRQERKQHRKGDFDELIRTRQRQAYEAKRAVQRTADRERAASQRAEQEAREKRLQIRHLIDYWKVTDDPDGTQRWSFVTRQNRIRSLYVTRALAEQLENGTVAIVEYPDAPEAAYVLVDRQAATQIARIDASYVRFHNQESARDAWS